MASTPEHRVIYLSSFEYPTQHAHPLHALLMARAFAELLPERFLFVVGKEDASVDTPHIVPFRRARSVLSSLHLRTLAYGVWLTFFLARNTFTGSQGTRNLIIFTNDLSLAAVASLIKPFFGYKLVIDVHGTAGRLVTKLALSGATKIIFVSEGLHTLYLHDHRIAGKSAVMGNAVDVKKFNVDAQTRQRTRDELAVNDTTTLLGYIGRFRPMQSDKGIRFMIDSLNNLPNDVWLLLVGGTDEEIEAEKKYVSTTGLEKRVILIPHIESQEVPRYMAACDILAYVPPQADRFLETETSPMKLYEYMASERPIIASDLPAFRAVLGNNALYIKPGDQAAFIQAVERARHPEQVQALVSSAAAQVADTTWTNRARRILSTV